MIRKFSAGRRWAARLATRALSRSLVLLYHRVATPVIDPQMLCVTPEHFSEHLEVLKRLTRPLPLRHVSNRVREGRVSPRGVVITFDDGYRDNLYNARPILERFDIPATIFVVSGWVDSDREFFWDALARILLNTPMLPDVLELEIAGKQRIWMFSGEKHDEESHRGDVPISMWNVQMDAVPNLRQRAYMELAALIRDLHPDERDETMSRVAAWAGVSAQGLPDSRVMSVNDLHDLQNGGLVEIGAHTVSHARLSQLSPADQFHEIAQSRKHLEMVLDHPVESFSYPFGTRTDYTPASIHAVREAGFRSACSNFEGCIHRYTSLWEMPRYLVRNWDGEEFERRLSAWW